VIARAEARSQSFSPHPTPESQIAAEVLPVLLQLREVRRRFIRDRNKVALLHDLLQLVMKATRTEFGNIQLFDSRSGARKIVAQHGLDAELLDFFRDVRDDGAACGTAMRARQRVVVEDVLTSPIFLGSLAQDILLRARVWAVQSTPLVTACGQLVG